MQWSGCQKCKTDSKLSQTASLPFYTVLSASIKCAKYRTSERLYSECIWNVNHETWENVYSERTQRRSIPKDRWVVTFQSTHLSIWKDEKWTEIAEPPWLWHTIEKGLKKGKKLQFDYFVLVINWQACSKPKIWSHYCWYLCLIFLLQKGIV